MVSTRVTAGTTTDIVDTMTTPSGPPIPVGQRTTTGGTFTTSYLQDLFVVQDPPMATTGATTYTQGVSTTVSDMFTTQVGLSSTGGMVYLTQCRGIMEVCASHNIYHTIVSYLGGFTLLDKNNGVKQNTRIKHISSIQLMEHTTILSCVTVISPHIHILWGVQVIVISLYKTSNFDVTVVVFIQDMVAGITPPSVTVDPAWIKL